MKHSLLQIFTAICVSVFIWWICQDREPIMLPDPVPEAIKAGSRSPREGKLLVTFYSDATANTATCMEPRRGSLAVDPKVIPMGTRVRLEGFPDSVPVWCMADDTGGMIKGKIIDVCIRNRATCMELGVIEAKYSVRQDRFGEYVLVTYIGPTVR